MRMARRKWVVAVLVVLVVIATPVLIVMLAGPDRRVDPVRALQEAGEPVTLEELNRLRAPVPESNTIAATIVRLSHQIAPLIKEDCPLNFREAVGYDGRLPNDVMILLRAYLVSHASLAQALHAASGLTPGAYPLAWRTDAPDYDASHLDSVEAAVCLLGSQAMYLASRGEVEPAADALIAAMHVTATVADEPHRKAQELRHGLEGWLANVFQGVMAMGRPDAKTLDRLALEWRPIAQPDPSFSLMMRGDRVRGIRLFAWLREIQAGRRSVESQPPYFEDLTTRIVPGILDSNEQVHLNHMRLCVEASALPLKDLYPHISRVHRDVQNRVSSGIYMPLDAASSSYAYFTVLYVRSRVLARSVLAAIDAEQYQRANGRWPQSLAELYEQDPTRIPLDSFNGDQPLRYVLKGDDCIIYSVDDDQQDDKGQFDLAVVPSSDVGVHLYAPRYRGTRALTQPTATGAATAGLKVIRTTTRPAGPAR